MPFLKEWVTCRIGSCCTSIWPLSLCTSARS